MNKNFSKAMTFLFGVILNTILYAMVITLPPEVHNPKMETGFFIFFTIWGVWGFQYWLRQHLKEKQ